MSEPDILYPAIFVFSMMLVGLLLTMVEFSRLRKSELDKADREKHNAGTNRDADADRVQKVSNY
jgi:hypothetical protein